MPGALAKPDNKKPLVPMGTRGSLRGATPVGCAGRSPLIQVREGAQGFRYPISANGEMSGKAYWPIGFRFATRGSIRHPRWRRFTPNPTLWAPLGCLLVPFSVCSYLRLSNSIPTLWRMSTADCTRRPRFVGFVRCRLGCPRHLSCFASGAVLL